LDGENNELRNDVCILKIIADFNRLPDVTKKKICLHDTIINFRVSSIVSAVNGKPIEFYFGPDVFQANSTDSRRQHTTTTEDRNGNTIEIEQINTIQVEFNCQSYTIGVYLRTIDCKDI
jgi:hypothetical protein